MLLKALPNTVTFDLPELDGGGWSFSLDEQWAPIFFDAEGRLRCEVREDFARSLATGTGMPVRVVRTYRCQQFVLHFDRTSKRILLTSPEASQELSILQWYDHFHELHDSLSEDERRRIEALRVHVHTMVSGGAELASDIERLTAEYGLPDLLYDSAFETIEAKAQVVIHRLVAEMGNYRQSPFEKLTDFMLDLTARYAIFRVHLLKFLALLPSLDFDTKGKEVKARCLEALRRLLTDSRRATDAGKTAMDGPVPWWCYTLCRLAYAGATVTPAPLLARSVRWAVRFAAKRFIAGETIERAADAFEGLRRTGREFTVDRLGELVVSAREADQYLQLVLEVIEGMQTHVTPGETNSAGIHKANVSVKVSALGHDLRPHAFDATYELIAPRLKKILLKAKECRVFVNIDAEHYHHRDLIFDIYKKVLLETPELADYDQTGIVVQAYLRDAYPHLLDILELAGTRNLRMPVRLVKGAYWDAETIHGDAHNVPAPQFLNKEETDLHFRQLVHAMLANGRRVQLVLASHNLHDHCWAEALRDAMFPTAPVIEHQCLHMTYEALSIGLARMGWPVRNYVPIGSLLMGMGYLVRRIIENSSQVGFLTMMRSHKNIEAFLPPATVHRRRKQSGEIVFDRQMSCWTPEFINIFPVRLYRKGERDDFFEAMGRFEREGMGRHYGPKAIAGAVHHESYSSSRTDLLVGTIEYMAPEHTDGAVKRARAEFEAGPWGTAHPFQRACVMLKAADLMLHRRLTLASLVIYEAGKAIEEALADVDEAIDFLNFYAREEMKLQAAYEHIGPRGILVVIPPWNFPIAIPAGMVGACLVAGNTVLLKSAGHTPLVAQALVDCLHDAGVPADALIHVPGPGSTVGSALVGHLDINGAVFTGSKEVGTWMFHEVGSRVHRDGHRVLPNLVITEMGGKNAIIVTANAELDETIAGCLYSAFAHAGQKCSAASRFIVHREIRHRFVERLREAVRDIKVGPAYEGASYINPLIAAKEVHRVRREVKEALEEAESRGGACIIDRTGETLPGHCIGPAVIELPAEAATTPDSYAGREFFAPVVHVIPYANREEAVQIHNSVEYGLTGGVFSQSQDDIDYYLARMAAGNNYVNRPNTGARVAIEPFGGFKMSGTGPKAGSRAYVRAFHTFTIAGRNYERPAPGEEGGTERDYQLPKPSPQGVATRRHLVCRLAEDLRGRAGDLFPDAGATERDLLASFQRWTQQHLDGFVTGRHENRTIPGQISYDDYRLIKQRGVFITNQAAPSFEMLANWLAALAVGSGVAVLACNRRAYDVWSTIVGRLYSWGVPRDVVRVYFAAETMIERCLEEHELEFVMVDTDSDRLVELLKLIHRPEIQRKYMISVLTGLDAPALGHWDDFCEQFVHKRSMAINTVRYGAPLELDG